MVPMGTSILKWKSKLFPLHRIFRPLSGNPDIPPPKVLGQKHYKELFKAAFKNNIVPLKHVQYV